MFTFLLFDICNYFVIYFYFLLQYTIFTPILIRLRCCSSSRWKIEKHCCRLYYTNNKHPFETTETLNGTSTCPQNQSVWNDENGVSGCGCGCHDGGADRGGPTEGREFRIEFHPWFKGEDPSSPGWHSSVTRVCMVQPLTMVAVIVFNTVFEYVLCLIVQPFHPSCPHRLHGTPLFVIPVRIVSLIVGFTVAQIPGGMCVGGPPLYVAILVFIVMFWIISRKWWIETFDRSVVRCQVC